MGYIRLGLIAAFLPISAPSWAAPDDHSGAALFEECQTNSEYCDALALGFFFGSRVARDLPHELCIDESTTAQQLGEILIGYMRNHPNRLEGGQIALVAEAMISAYRCDQPKKRG